MIGSPAMLQAWVTAWLLAAYTGGDVDANRNQLDAIRTAGTVVVGTGGAAALLLAARRQRATEIGLRQKELDQALQRQANAVAEHDAAERRVTDLYTKAADQLGSEKAPVRLAGLYALERLAQDHAEQRQTVANVLCAYLRMPYAPPGDAPADDAGNKIQNAYQERVQEREVRQTAQRILADHLRPTTESNEEHHGFWPGIRIDLVNATLVNCSFGRCHLSNATFRGATFIGYAWFVSARLDGAVFSHVTFRDLAHFENATVNGGILFYGSKFLERAWFMRANLTFDGRLGVSPFDKAEFHGEVRFDEATVPPVDDRHRSWQATVADRHNDRHVWPLVWQVEADSEGDGGRVREAGGAADLFGAAVQGVQAEPGQPRVPGLSGTSASRASRPPWPPPPSRTRACTSSSTSRAPSRCHSRSAPTTPVAARTDRHTEQAALLVCRRPPLVYFV